MELEGAIGRKAKISLDDGTHIDGFVHSVSASSGKISLEKVECFENGKKKKLVGLQHYFAEEITKIVLTEDVCKNKKKTKTHERQGGGVRGGLMKGKCSASHLNRLEFVDPSSLVLKNQRRTDALTSSGNETGGSDSDMDLPQSDSYTIIPKLCNTFYEAIAYIMKHQVVAVAMEGVAIGRCGRLCWLQIAVADHVFMFDMLTMGRSCFDEGVKDILENGDILKVLHDCRMVSDLLHHQYDINMINVFDTQGLIANSMDPDETAWMRRLIWIDTGRKRTRLKHHHDWPRYVDGLGSCLVQHLDLPIEEVNWAVVREQRREEDEEVWTSRPPQRHLVEAAVKNVKHLLDLRTILMEKMMEEFVAGVNIYLMHVRDASDNDARRYQTTSHLLPVAFQDIRAFMSSYHGRNHFNVTDVQKDMNGFRENCSGIAQPDVYFSKDSIWHAGTKKTGFRGPRSASSLANSQVSSQTKASGSSEGKASVLTEGNASKSSKGNASVVSNGNALLSSQDSISVSSQGNISSSAYKPSDEDFQETSSVLSDDTVIPTRRNLHTSPESDLVFQTVAAINAKKLAMDAECSGTELNEPKVNGEYTADLGQLRHIISGNEGEHERELKGGSLMRALVHEQDATGNEAKADMEKFNIKPAGKMVAKNTIKKKAKPDSDTYDSFMPDGYLGYQVTHQSLRQSKGHFMSSDETPSTQRQYVPRNPCDELRPVIPGGDLATYSPPKHYEVNPQEQTLIEDFENSQQGRDFENTRKPGFPLGSEAVLHQTSSQRVNSILSNQLLGKSSGHSYASDPGTSVSHPLGFKESGYSSPNTAEVDYQSEDWVSQNFRPQPTSRRDITQPTSPTSKNNSKLQSLLQKLKQQSL